MLPLTQILNWTQGRAFISDWDSEGIYVYERQLGYTIAYHSISTVVSRRRAHYGLSAHPLVLPRFPVEV